MARVNFCLKVTIISIYADVLHGTFKFSNETLDVSRHLSRPLPYMAHKILYSKGLQFPPCTYVRGLPYQLSVHGFIRKEYLTFGARATNLSWLSCMGSFSPR